MIQQKYVLAFDTANEVIAIGIGELEQDTRSVRLIAHREVSAHRASNTKLLPEIDNLLTELEISRDEIACVTVGRGPGSFTGVRIAMATAKGMASALEVALVGVSSLDAVAWGVQQAGVCGTVLIAADAMRKEVYPVIYTIDNAGITRLDIDRVMKVPDAVAQYKNESDLRIAGDALVKYAEAFEECGTLLPENVWTPTGQGLLAAVQAAWRANEIDPFDAGRHNPAYILPVYTRLSDAEENERLRIARENQELAHARGSKHVTMNDMAISNTRANGTGIAFKPLDRLHCAAVAQLEAQVMGSDAWNENLVADELGREDRLWWAAYAADPTMPLPEDAPLVGYFGAWIVDGDMQILKVGTHSEWRRMGIARALLAQVISDARNLSAKTCSLEVRVSNEGAQQFYETMGMQTIGKRPRYYSDGEDAFIMQGSLEVVLASAEQGSVAGMELQHHEEHVAEMSNIAHPLILAIESSCDETAAAVVNGDGSLLSDVVASQIDFHARFGGVVPEIASRKHIEAICGVCDETLERAAHHAHVSNIRWRDLSAVAVTYAPGLVGALVVGVAFAKGVAWGANIPFIGVNHLEGHLYANKIGNDTFAPPAVVSLVSGGNTMLVHMRDWGDYKILGTTIDDAVGEAFDKVAKALGLGYPGGPVISRFAAQGNADAIAFPRAMMHSGDLRFSLSGLKTAVVTYINNERAAGRELNIPDIAASFQQAVVDVQIKKAKMALEQTEAPTFCLGGGVAANPVLRKAYEDLCAKMGVTLVMPPLASCGDNAGMIALVALDRFKQEKFFDLSADALAHTDLEQPY